MQNMFTSNVYPTGGPNDFKELGRHFWVLDRLHPQYGHCVEHWLGLCGYTTEQIDQLPRMQVISLLHADKDFQMTQQAALEALATAFQGTLPHISTKIRVLLQGQGYLERPKTAEEIWAEQTEQAETVEDEIPDAPRDTPTPKKRLRGKRTRKAPPRPAVSGESPDKSRNPPPERDERGTPDELPDIELDDNGEPTAVSGYTERADEVEIDSEKVTAKDVFRDGPAKRKTVARIQMGSSGEVEV